MRATLPWTSPYAAENADSDREPQPSPHVSFDDRVEVQEFAYDHLGNPAQTTDDAHGFWDRSLGETTRGTAGAGPHQILAASNRSLAPSSSRKGDLSVAYDAGGDMTDLIVRRDGACLPSGASCFQRFHYEWSELGEITRARRWDLSSGEQSNHGELTDSLPTRDPDAELRYTYSGGARVIKTAVKDSEDDRHTVYVFSTLELRSTTWDDEATEPDYEQDPENVQVRLPAGPAVARVIYSEESLPTLTSGEQHILLQLSDHIGSTNIVIDHATGELVEYTTYQAYGATESDYRPGRWAEFREPYKFSGKEEDIEVGLGYFGARYYSPYLGTWLSTDPVTIHELGSDINPYAYVHGTPLMGVDPDGREPILLGIGIGIAVGAAIAGGSSVAVQAATVGWDNINWGWDGVAGAAVTGAVAGGVSGGLGSFLGGSGGLMTNALGSFWGSLGAAGTSGAVAGGASYLTGAGLSGSKVSAGGLFQSMGIGAAGGMAGALGGLGAGALGGSQLVAGLTGAGSGALGGYGTSLAFGAEFSPTALALSVGAGMAGAIAAYGVREAARPEAVPNQLRNPSNKEVAQALQTIEAQLAAGERVDAARTAMDLWGVPREAALDINHLAHGDATITYEGKAGGITYDPSAFTKGAGFLSSLTLHESVHLGQWYNGQHARFAVDGLDINEVEAWTAELRNAGRHDLSAAHVQNRIDYNIRLYQESAAALGLHIDSDFRLPAGALTKPRPGRRR